MICLKCNKDASLDLKMFGGKKIEMEEKKMCFNCLYWEERVNRITVQTQIVINGYCYQVAPEKNTNNSHKGYYGEKKIIKRHDGIIITTSNLWGNGLIPDVFRNELPDNAVFLNAL